MQSVLRFEENDRFWYSFKSSKSKNAKEDWLVICDEEIYDKFVIWNAKKKSKQKKDSHWRKTRVWRDNEEKIKTQFYFTDLVFRNIILK